ncbi:MAG TPA: hypothetical protein VEJ87_08570 [Acidimicrobiales bacterium]|nr:hypothetical protein [Acidimicrobiales bacterium]
MKPDQRPILMCRLECPAEQLEMLDDWIPKHLDDSLAHRAVTSAGNYEIIRDFASLPSVLNHHGNRMVNYATEDIEGCLEWLDSEELRGAIEDGVDRESQYPQLDGEPFIGNIYVPGDVVGGSPEDFIRDGTWYVERFEVPEAEISRFEAWSTKQLHELVALEGAVRARSWAQYRDAPRRFPFDRYRSKGNRMISLELQAHADPMELSRDERFASALQASVAEWDAHLPYVRRDLTRNIVVRP